MKAIGALLFTGFSRVLFVLAMVGLFVILSQSEGRGLPVFAADTAVYWFVFTACLFLSLFLELMAQNSENLGFIRLFGKSKSTPKKVVESNSAPTPEQAANPQATLVEPFHGPPLSFNGVPTDSQEDVLIKKETTMSLQIQPEAIDEVNCDKKGDNSEQASYVNVEDSALSICPSDDADSLQIEINVNALSLLGKNGDVFILTSFENPKYSYYKLKGYDADLLINFVEFVNVCKTSLDNAKTEYATSAFSPISPTDSTHGLEFYLEKSGYSTVDEWLKTVIDKNAIPECSAGSKVLCVYRVRSTRKA